MLNGLVLVGCEGRWRRSLRSELSLTWSTGSLGRKRMLMKIALALRCIERRRQDLWLGSVWCLLLGKGSRLSWPGLDWKGNSGLM